MKALYFSSIALGFLLMMAGVMTMPACSLVNPAPTTQLSPSQAAKYTLAQGYDEWANVSQDIDEYRIGQKKNWSDPAYAPIKSNLLKAKQILDAADNAAISNDSSTYSDSLSQAQAAIGALRTALLGLETAPATSSTVVPGTIDSSSLMNGQPVPIPSPNP